MSKIVNKLIIMTEAELISACIKNEKTAKKLLFERYYNKFAFVSLRYSKNNIQAEELLLNGFNSIFNALPNFKNQTELSLEDFARHELISFLVKEIKNIRNEYYVASTVKATEVREKSYDLFLDNFYVDFTAINQNILIKSLHELVPSQRLAFNLQVIEGYNLSVISDLLETNEQTVKSNIEKARFNLQKIIEKNLKLNQNEQPV